MVSSERTKIKPYAILVQYVPYKSLTDQQVRAFIKSLRATMTELGLTVVGKLIWYKDKPQEISLPKNMIEPGTAGLRDQCSGI